MADPDGPLVIAPSEAVPDDGIVDVADWDEPLVIAPTEAVPDDGLRNVAAPGKPLVIAPPEAVIGTFIIYIVGTQGEELQSYRIRPGILMSKALKHFCDERNLK